MYKQLHTFYIYFILFYVTYKKCKITYIYEYYILMYYINGSLLTNVVTLNKFFKKIQRQYFLIFIRINNLTQYFVLNNLIKLKFNSQLIFNMQKCIKIWMPLRIVTRRNLQIFVQIFYQDKKKIWTVHFLTDFIVCQTVVVLPTITINPFCSY